MNNPLESDLLQLNTTPENRKIFTQRLLASPLLIEEVLVFILDEHKDVSGKATRALELVCQKDATLIFQHKKKLFDIASTTKQDDVIRPLAKIFELWTLDHFSKNPTIQLQTKDQEKITAICFDWLISPQKVAPQAYSMQTLYLLGTKTAWIHPELKLILEHNYARGTSGYKARARKILQKINKPTTT